MRTSLLLRREPFGGILTATLGSYWRSRHGIDYEVYWHERHPGRRKLEASGTQAWHGNVYLNVFAADGTPPDYFEVLRHEYGRSVQPARRLVQRLYVWLASRESFRSCLAQVAFSVRPGVPEAGSSLILGGNHRLRLLHPARGACTVVLKQGFARRYVAEEVALRRELTPACAPRLLTVALEHGWYEEEYRPGTPVNRLPPAQAFVVAREAHALLVAQVIGKTLRMDDASRWCGRLLEEGGMLANAEPLSRAGLTDTAKGVIRAARSAVARFLSPGAQIVTAMTHGDFQPANVLATAGGVTVIDWECATRRFAGYDAMVYALDARGSGPFAAGVRALLSGSGACGLLRFEPWPGVEWGGEAGSRTILYFLLEELLFVLRENAEPEFLRLETGFLVQLRDIAAALVALTD